MCLYYLLSSKCYLLVVVALLVTVAFFAAGVAAVALVNNGLAGLILETNSIRVIALTLCLGYSCRGAGWRRSVDNAADEHGGGGSRGEGFTAIGGCFFRRDSTTGDVAAAAVLGDDTLCGVLHHCRVLTHESWHLREAIVGGGPSRARVRHVDHVGCLVDLPEGTRATKSFEAHLGWLCRWLGLRARVSRSTSWRA